MPIREDLTGLRFGRLVVVALTDKMSGHNKVWKCICDCGGEANTSAWKLKNGVTQSCGCYNKERIIETSTTHGLCNSPECKTWYSMRQRCTNRNNREYKWYGGRGIKVCERWIGSFENFFADMGERPSNKHSIERRDVNGNYEPSNCYWATKDIQANNTRANVFYTHDGITLTQAQWAKKLQISNKCLWAFINRGNSISDAVRFYADKERS